MSVFLHVDVNCRTFFLDIVLGRVAKCTLFFSQLIHLISVEIKFTIII